MMKGYQLYFPIELTIFIVAVCRYKLNQTLIWVFKMSKAAVLIWLLGCCWRNCVATVQLSNAILAAATQSCQYSAIICTGYIFEKKIIWVFPCAYFIGRSVLCFILPIIYLRCNFDPISNHHRLLFRLHPWTSSPYRYCFRRL